MASGTEQIRKQAESGRRLDPRVHAALDLGLGLGLLVLPGLLDFPADAAALSRILGVAVLTLGAVTKWRGAFLYWVPLKAHLAIDAFTGVFAVASPWLFGFSDDTSATVLLSVAGIAQILLVLLTNANQEVALPPLRKSPRTIEDGSSVRRTLADEDRRVSSNDPGREDREPEGGELSDSDSPEEWPDPARRDEPVG